MDTHRKNKNTYSNVNHDQPNFTSAVISGPTFRVAIVLSFSLAIFVRFFYLGIPDYWLDEFHSLSNSAGLRDVMESVPYGEIVHDWPNYTDLNSESSWGSVWDNLKYDSHPPVYFMVLQTWRLWWGDLERATRSLSGIVSVLSILPIALIFFEQRKQRLFLWMIVGLALCFSHILMAQESRPYSMGMLWVGLSYWLFLRLEKHGATWSNQQRWFELSCYTLMLWLAMMTHYFTSLAILGQVVYAMLRIRGPMFRYWIIAIIVSAMFWLIAWGSTFAAQQDFISRQDWLYEKSADHVTRTLYRIADLPYRLLFNHERFAFHYGQMLIGVAIVVLCFVRCWKVRNSYVLLFFLWYCTPVMVFAAIDCFTDRQLLAHIRYISIAGPGLVGMIVVAVYRSDKIMRWLVGSLLMMTVMLTLSLPTPKNPKSLLAAEMIKDQIHPGDLLVYDAIDWPRDWIPQFFVPVSNYLTEIKNPFILLRDAPDDTCIQQIQSFARWIVISPRIDATPNPLPESYRLFMKSPYVDQVGWVYIFTRNDLP